MESGTEELVTHADTGTWAGTLALGDLAWGTHFCHFYQNRTDLLDVVVPYIRAGFENGERCFWLTCGPVNPDQARLELQRAFRDADERLADGDIEIASCEDWYLDGADFDADRVIAAWLEKERDALARGYTGLRVHANEAWLTRSLRPAFIEYERRLDATLEGRKLVILCTYPLEGSTGSDIFDVGRTHQFAIARRHGHWEILESADSIGARAELRRLSAELEQRVVFRTEQLATTNAVLEDNLHRLKVSEARFRVFINNASDAIFLHDEAGTIIDVNRVASESLGMSREELLGMTLDDLQAGLDSSSLAQIRRRLMGGEVVTFQTEFRRNDGVTVPLEIRARSFFEEGRRFAISMARDITDRVQLEEQFRQAQKMDAVGRLAGGIAHDFNNMLTVINGYADMLAAELRGDADRLALVGEIRAAGDRAATLTHQLLAFSRKEQLHPELVDANATLADISMLLRRLIGEHIEIDISGVATEGFMRVDPGQLQQAIINLAVNARDAMPHGGQLRISARAMDLGPETHEGSVPPGSYIVLCVADTGHGMDNATRLRIFEPFFTTKERGKGTGLGLTMVYGFVQQSHGHLTVASAPNKGTTIKMYLPQVSGASRADRVEAAQPLVPSGTETVLLAEDDEAVRRLCRLSLESHGYKVLVASDGAEAMQIAESYPDPIHALVSDTVMPKMGGIELTGALRESRPGIRVLLMSGYTEEGVDIDLIGAHAFLEKPFTPVDLVRATREIIDAGRGR